MMQSMRVVLPVCLIVTGVVCLHAQERPVGASTVPSGEPQMVSYAPALTEQARISLELKNVTLKEAIYTIASKTGLAVSFSGADLPLERRISVSLNRATPQQAFTTVVRGLGVNTRFSSDGQTVFFVLQAPVESQRQNDSLEAGTLTGRVVDSATGAGIGGVVVTVQKTKLSTTTTDNGDFSLTNVPAGEQTLGFKALGYTSMTRITQIESKKRTTLRVVLRQAANILSGIVTTATGQQRKLEVGNSIVSLNVDSILKVAPVSTITDLLESRVPGMIMQRTSGTPGDPARIRLRGTSSIDRNNDPIIVVDGVRMYSQSSDQRNINVGSKTGDFLNSNTGSYQTPSLLDQISPSSIETIEILKGPSASAMYGSDAGNGVIIITTKKGKAGTTNFDVALSQGVSYMPGTWPVNVFQWVTPLVGGFPQLCFGFCGDARVDSVMAFQALNDKRLTALGTGSESQVSATASGGSQTVRYAFTLAGGNTLGVLKLPQIEAERYARIHKTPAPSWMRRPDHLDNKSVTGRVDVTMNEYVNFALTTTLGQQRQRRTSMSSSSNTAIGDLEGKWVDLSQIADEPLLGNPFERVTSSTINMINALALNVRPWSWLPVNTTFGINTSAKDNEARIARDMLSDDCANGCWKGSTQNTTELTSTLSTTIPASSLVAFAIGLNFTEGKSNDQMGSFTGFAEGVSDPSGGTLTQNTIFQRSTSERRSFGWFLEPRLNINSRFFVMPGFRLDNNGLAGRNAKLNGLPKINLSWIASDERFFPFKDLIPMLRIRTAFGVAGVQPNLQDVTRLYTTRVRNPFQSLSPEYGDLLDLAYLGNTRLRPERGTEVEGGIDAELWNGRFTLELTHWRKRRTDAIVSSPYAPSAAGGGNLKINVGDIDNSGTEIGMTLQLLERRVIGFNVGMSMSWFRSKVVRLGADGQRLTLGNPREGGPVYVEGYPMEGVWALPIVGALDVNNDGWIGRSEMSLGADEVFVGSMEPDFQLSAHPNLTLFGGMVNLNASLSYVGGQLQGRGEGSYDDGVGRLIGINTPGVSWAAQSAFLAYREGLSPIGVLQIVDVLRVQSLSISTNLSQRATAFLRARTGSIALQGRNLGLWTNYMGVDPNVNGAPSGHGSIDSGQLPQPRSWQLRVTLGY